jgi:hypothetical protein
MRDPTTRYPVRSGLAAGAAVAVTAGLLLLPVPPGRLGPWQGQILDFGHVPLFAALVLALRAATGPPLRRSVVVAVAVAGLAEVVQPAVGRSGDAADFLRGILGALAAGAAIRAWECRRSRGRCAAYLGLALALLAGPAVEAAPYLADTARGRRSFPVLAEFSTDLELRRWECDQATITRVDGPDGAVGRIALLPGPEPYSSAALRPVVPDFRGYRWVCCAVRVGGGAGELVTSVRSGAAGQPHTTHAQVGHRLAAGDHVVRLDLAALAAAARPDPLDLADVRCVQLFAAGPPGVVVVDVSRVWLEP